MKLIELDRALEIATETQPSDTSIRSLGVIETRVILRVANDLRLVVEAGLSRVLSEPAFADACRRTWAFLVGELARQTRQVAPTKFTDAALSGAIDPDATIGDYIDRWHASPGGEPLHTWLGLELGEYVAWLETRDDLKSILLRRESASRNRKNLRDLWRIR